MSKEVPTLIKDYKDDEKLKLYLESSRSHPSMSTRYYTLYSLLPDLREKVILDLPCGMGDKARRFILQSGAKKVIASDIAQKQLELSEQADTAAGITPDQIQYVLHNAADAKVIADIQADICVSIHLLCFAESYADLVNMTKCIYLNLKPGGACYSIVCSLTKHKSLARRFEEFDAEIIHLDSWQGDAMKARRFNYINNGFNYNVCLWDYSTICQAFEEAGFSKVELHPYKEDPAYGGKDDLTLFNSILEGNVIVAMR